MKILYWIVVGILLYTSQSLFAKVDENEDPSLKPLGFLENKGQIRDQYGSKRSDVLFTSSIDNLSIHLFIKGYSYQQTVSKKVVQESSQNDSQFSREDSVMVFRTDLRYINSNSDIQIERRSKNVQHYNYYLDSLPEGVLNVNSYNEVRLINVFNGIDIRWKCLNEKIKYDYLVEPFAEPQSIKFKVSGTENLSIDTDGNLVLKTLFGEIIEEKPIAFQGDHLVEIRWKIFKGNVVGFEMGEYNIEEELIIDPVVRTWGTFLGGAGKDEVVNNRSMGGGVVVVGNTTSYASIATTGSHQVNLGGSRDGFLARLDSEGILQWATYFGGSSADLGIDCAVDNMSNIFITGHTSSTSSIASTGSYQQNFGGSVDVFVAKFNSAGTRLWSTYFGGTSDDRGYSCSTDNLSNVYVTGITNSTAGIATIGSHKSTIGGGTDAFLAKFDSFGTLSWATYYGGTALDVGSTLAVDGIGNVYLAGSTESSTGISSIGAYKATISGVKDVFIVKFTELGQRNWSTYYGGGDEELCGQIISKDAFIYLTGSTGSTSQISSAGVHQSSYGGNQDAFLVRFDTSGTRSWATYYGGSGQDYGTGCVIDNNTNIYVSGHTSSTSNMTTLDGYQQSMNGGLFDAFVVKLDSTGSRVWSTYFGGSNDDYCYGICLGLGNRIHISGYTNSGDNIASDSAYQVNIGGDFDAYIAQLNFCQKKYASISQSGCDSYLSPSQRHVYTSSGIYIDTLLTSEGCDSIITISLTIYHSIQKSIEAIACTSYVSPSGKYTFFKSGQYYDTLMTSEGCDSIIDIKLSIKRLKTRVIMEGARLSCLTQGATYQWYDCRLDKIISNQTDSIFYAPDNGVYAAIVSKNSCVDTSDCFGIEGVGLEQLKEHKTLCIYPSPTWGEIAIDLSKYKEEVTLSIYNSRGQLIDKQSFVQGELIYKSITGSPGMYLIRATIKDKEVGLVKVIKK